MKVERLTRVTKKESDQKLKLVDAVEHFYVRPYRKCLMKQCQRFQKNTLMSNNN